MNHDIFRFEFAPSVLLDDPEMSLHLALFAIEGLFGRACVRLDTKLQIDKPGVGALVVPIFTGLLLSEFGEEAFGIKRCSIATDPSKPE